MRRVTVLVLAAALAAPGCGGGASDDVKSAVKSYLNAFVDGDGAKACSLMTDATRRQFVEKTKAITKSTDCSLAIEAIRTQAGAEVTAALAKLKFTNVKVNGNRATVTLESGGSKSTATLVKEGGGWKVSGAPGTQ
jgi:Domain of unknown function (DUF4878)